MVLTFVDNIKAWAWSDIAHPVNIMLSAYQTIVQYERAKRRTLRRGQHFAACIDKISNALNAIGYVPDYSEIGKCQEPLLPTTVSQEFYIGMVDHLTNTFSEQTYVCCISFALHSPPWCSVNVLTMPCHKFSSSTLYVHDTHPKHDHPRIPPFRTATVAADPVVPDNE
jgi:hypothetical protein